LKTSIDSVEFFYRKFYYNRHTLTPRLETESLVRSALNIIQNEQIDAVMDVWTWSAIIWISIEKESGIDHVYWLEKSASASKVARSNIALHDSKMKLIKSDLLSHFFKEKELYDFKGKNVLFVANLPYIKNEDWINMSEDTVSEPKMALFWWPISGFELYEKFFRQLFRFKDCFWIQKIFSISEIWFDQKDVAQDYFKKIWLEVAFLKDLRWIDRFINIEI